MKNSHNTVAPDYKKIFQSSPGAYLILSPNLRIIEVSDAYLLATMRKREDLIGSRLFDAFPNNPSDPSALGAENLRLSLERVIREGSMDIMDTQKYDIQKPIEQGGGFEERYWNPKNIPIFDSENRLEYIVHCVEDVTELVKLHHIIDNKKNIRSDLRTSRGDLASVIVDEMYQFVALLDKNGRLLEVNRPALEGTGLKMSDVRGEFMWEVPVWNVTPENFSKVKEASLRGCQGEFVREELLLFAAAAGREVVTIDFSIKPVRDINGKIDFLLAEGRNITERKAAEAEIERKNKELAQLNARLRELDKLKTEFFANVSHELRTPLSLILGPIQKILQTKDPTIDETKNLAVVERNARLLLKHVNDLLDISRLEAGAMSLKYSESDLSWLGRYVASFFEFLAKDRQMTFDVEIPDSLVGHFDLEKIERVLLNLISNAFKFTPTGGTISFSLKQQGDKAVFIVKDNGPGIPEELIHEAFERFRQLESSPSRRFGGTGLGLSIVKEFIEQHQGHISMANVHPHGLSVRIEIPLRAPPETPIYPQPEEINKEVGTTYVEEFEHRHDRNTPEQTEENLSSPLILIVEDNDDVREFLKQILSVQYRTISAHNGVEGLQKALKTSPELIIADIMMPHMSGEEMVLELRKYQETSDIPVLMLTARAEDDLRVKMLEQGVQDFLTKPFHAKELLARAGRLIEERKKAVTTLKISEERYRVLVEATTSVVWTTNKDGKIETPQVSWQKFTGQTAAAMEGLGWINAFHPDDRVRLQSAWLEAIDSSKLFEAKGRIWNQAHSMYRHFIARGISLKNIDGTTREWVVTIYDTHERTTMDQQLRFSLHEKEILLKEMHHRVKNNMQVISSLLRLQAKTVEEKKLKDILEESQNRIRAMALVHEKLYRSPSLSKIDFGDYLSLLVRELFSTLSFSERERITLQLDLDPVDLDVSKAIPCGLLINELLSNCLKHAFPDDRSGIIKVSLKQTAKTSVLLAVSDNGVGLPDHTQMSQVNTLGLQIVKTLVSQLGGILSCDRADGTHWSIQFETAAPDDIRSQITAYNSQTTPEILL